MSEQPNIADIRLQLAALGVDPSRVRGVEVDEEGKLLVVVERETPRPATLNRAALLGAIAAAAAPRPKRSAPIFVDRRRATPVRAADKLDRYRECECGSGAKFKFCCGRRGA